MRPAALGVAYYIWLSRKRALIALLALACFLGALAPLLGGETATAVAAMYAVLCLVGCCLMTGLHFEAVLEAVPPRFGYPHVLFALPVTTRALVLWPLLFGSSGLIVIWVIGSVIISSWLGVKVPTFVPCLAIVATLASVQATLWAPTVAAPLKVLALIPAAVAPSALVLSLYDRVGVPEYGIAGILIAILILASCAAVAGVAADRRGDIWLKWPSFPKPVIRPSPQATQISPFKCPGRAQFWYDLNRPFGRALACWAAFQFAPFLLAPVGAVVMSPEMAHILVASILLGCPVLGVLLSHGIALDAARRSAMLKLNDRQEGNTFSWLRPIRTSELAVSLCQTSLVVVCVSWLLWGIICLVVWECWSFIFAREGAAHVLARLLAPFLNWRGFGVMALSVAALAGATFRLDTDRTMMRSSFCSSSGVNFAFSLALAIVNGLVAIGVSLALDPVALRETIDVMIGTGVALLVLKVLAALLAFRGALRERLFDALTARKILLAWVVTVGMLLGLAIIVLPERVATMPKGLVLLGAGILVPLGRFAWLPLALDRCRHRR